MYFCLVNLFGEYPLIDTHSNGGKVVATFVAIVAVAVFAIPTGVLGAGFTDMMEDKRSEEDAKAKATSAAARKAEEAEEALFDEAEDGPVASTVDTNPRDFRERLYRLLNGQRVGTATQQVPEEKDLCKMRTHQVRAPRVARMGVGRIMSAGAR